MARRRVLEHSPWLVVESHSVELPDGRILDDWPWIITPDFVNVVAESAVGKFLCFQQRKYGISDPSKALVGGYVLPGESPLDAAIRELREETGYAAPDWSELGFFRVDPNQGVAMCYFFLARGAVQRTMPVSDDLEDQQLVELDRDELGLALDTGDFKALSWAAAVGLALRRLR